MRLYVLAFLPIIFVLQVWSRIEPIPSGILETRLSLAKCIGAATERFFEDHEISLVSLSTIESSNVIRDAIAFDRLLFSELFNRSNLSIIIKKTTEPNANESYMKRIDNYIIQIRSPTEIIQNLVMLKVQRTWNSHAKFLVISATHFKDTNKVALTILKRLWSYKIMNAIAILADPKKVGVFTIYSWSPFSEEHCKTGFNDVQVIDKCSLGRFYKGKSWFHNKRYHNLHGCTFRVRAVIWPPYVLPPEEKAQEAEKDLRTAVNGLEPMLLKTMSEIANFSIIYTIAEKVQDWGSVSINGTATGTLLALKNEECDIAIGSFATSFERNLYFDYVVYDLPESLAWCVPHAEETDQWKKLLMVTPISIWCYCFIICFLTSTCVWLICFYEPEESTSYKVLASSTQNMFCVLVNMAVKRQPRALRVRLLFLVWCFFALHITASYQTSLISVLTRPKYDQQIKTLDDIFANNLNMYILQHAKRYFKNDDIISNKVRRKFRYCKDIGKCLNATAFDRDSVTCTPRLYMKYAVNHYVTEDGTPLLYCFRDSVATYPLEMLLAKGFPLRDYFKLLINRITSAGLIAYWEKRLFEIKFRDKPYRRSHRKDNTLTISHLQLIFIVLIIGNTIACLIFFLEIYLYKRLSRK